jgi:LPS export ABC transporter protein LptC
MHSPTFLKPKALSENVRQLSQCHSERVKRLRTLLPLAGLGVVILVCLWSSLERFFERKIEGIPQYAKRLTLQNEVLNPIIVSTDNAGNPFRLSAERGTQTEEEKAVFEKPVSELTSRTGNHIKVSSKAGLLNPHDNTFTYFKEAHLKEAQGHWFKTTYIKVDLKKQRAHSVAPVKGAGPMGALEAAQGFTLNKEEQTLTLHGPTKLLLNNK